MPRFPRLAAHLRLEVVAPDLAVVFSEHGERVFEGRIVPLLAPYLEGRRSVAEIADTLRGTATVVDIEFGLSLLASQHCLALDDSAPLEELVPASWPAERVAFFESLGVPVSQAAERLARVSLEVRMLGRLDPGPWREALEALGLPPTADGDHLLVVTDDYRHPELAGLHRRELARNRPWMLARPVGRRTWVGPVLDPPRTACWACLAHRLEQNRPRLELARGDGAALPASPTLPSALALALHATALQVLRWLALDDDRLAGRLIELDFATLGNREHVFVRRTGCPDCGLATPKLHEPGPIQISSTRICPGSAGGYRTVAPEETLARLAHHVSPLTGLVGALEEADIPGHGRAVGGHVVFADHVFPAADGREAIVTGGRRRSAGKGTTISQARVSALCEALERISGIFRGGEPRIRARYCELGEQAVHPALYLGYSEKQYAERDRWNRSGNAYAWVPHRFDEQDAVEWSPLWSLTHERGCYLPTACCYFRGPQPSERPFARGDSNGCSAGNTLEEAILQGFLELVERDAVALWWYNRIPRPEVSVASFDRPELMDIVRSYQRLGRRIHVYDLTHDLAIPTLAAISWAEEGPPRPLLGFGAHLDVGIALARALTEMGQFLPGLLAGRDRAILSRNDPDLGHLEPRAAVERRERDDFPEPRYDDLADALAFCVDTTRQHGLEILVLDQTREDIGLPVVKVVVPGLRHYWPRFGPGRLYDVPIALGWLDEPRREDELEPAHLAI